MRNPFNPFYPLRTSRNQFSQDLNSWSDLTTYTNNQYSMQFLDPQPSYQAARFYRVISP